MSSYSTPTSALRQPQALPRPQFADWEAEAPRLNLRRVGRELVGPCPICGGRDRFAILSCDDGRAVANCRTCELPDWRKLLEAVFGQRFSLPHQTARNGPLRRPSRKRPEHTRQPGHADPRTERRGDTSKFAEQLWSEAKPIPTPASTDSPSDHPARLWLAARSLIHGWATCPATLRFHRDRQWIIAACWPLPDYRAAWPALPTAPPTAAQAIAIDATGNARICDQWEGHNKRSYGPIKKACFALGDPATVAHPVRITEGVADALGIWSRIPGLVFAALGGLARYDERPGVLARLYGRRTAIHADADEAGQRDATALASRLKAQGISAAVFIDRANGRDPAEWAQSQAFPEFDPDEFDTRAGRFLNASLDRAEADRLALLIGD